MNEFDQYVKHRLKVPHYIRYADDFVLLSPSRDWLIEKIKPLQQFLWECLQLSLHPRKIFLKTIASGVDFLGWVHFPHHRVLRPATARRMHRRIHESPTPATLQSYLGLLQHGNTQILQHKLLDKH